MIRLSIIVGSTVLSAIVGLWMFIFDEPLANQKEQDLVKSEVRDYMKKGETLPYEIAKKFPLNEQPVVNDRGINVLIDMAHSCTFQTLWRLPERLNKLGFRVCGSQAVLSTVLNEKGYSRIRIPFDEKKKLYPFAWYPNPRFNVVITEQNKTYMQEYLEEEQQELKEFVHNGGGLVICAKVTENDSLLNSWSLNRLIAKFDARINGAEDFYKRTIFNELSVSEDWEIIQRGTKGKIVQARRKYGKGHVVVTNLQAYKAVSKLETEEKDKQIQEILLWAAQGKKPVGGDTRLPVARASGGGIYPELERKYDNIVFFYAKNQKESLLKIVNKDIPRAKEFVINSLPSKNTSDPFYMILSAGNGGGWAVNAYSPKETGVISSKCKGVLSVFGHELAHNLEGPVNDLGFTAAKAPIGEQGEDQAGWFQGKVDALFDKQALLKSNRDCNRIFEVEGVLTEMDLASKASLKAFKRKGWYKTWYIWQKLDDRYGTGWYPRWKYIQHTRWKNQPQKCLSWDEMVEDMSIAVGEDLFPFFRKLGTTLKKNRLEKIEFDGKLLHLREASLEITPADPVKLNDIGDYTKPLQIIQN